MDTLLSHYAGDILCVIFPGLIFIGLYGGGFLECVRTTLKRSVLPDFLLTVFIILSAWFVGKTIETVVYTPFYIYHQLQSNSKEEPQRTNADSATAGGNDASMNELQQHDWRQAAVGGFRNLGALSVWATFFPPTISGKKLPRRYGVIATLIFAFCWASQHIQVYGFCI